MLRAWIDGLASAGPDGEVLLGYSLGGRIALAAAARHPRRWRALVLVGASAGLAGAEARAQRRAHDERWARTLLSRGTAAFLADWEAQPLLASTTTRLSPEALAARTARRRALPAPGLAASLRTFGTGSLPALRDPALRTLRTPVLLVHGAEDAKFAAVAAELAGRLPRARVEAIPHAGHAAHLERPDRVAEAVRAWLASLD